MATWILGILIFGYSGYLVYKLFIKKDGATCHEKNCNCAVKERTEYKKTGI